MPYSQGAVIFSWLSKARAWPAVVLAWLVAGCLCASATAEQMSLRQFGQADGLANQAVTSIVQDGDGYLWIGTENGLFHFDGARFRRYGKRDGLPAPFITALATDAAGRVWIGTDAGVCQWRREGCAAVAAPDGAPMVLWPGQRFARNGGDVMLVVGKRDLLEVRPGAAPGTWQSRYYFSEAQRRAHPELGQIGSIAAGPDGDLWMGCGQQVCRYGAGGLTRYGPQQGVPAAMWRAIFAARDGTMWLRSQDYMLSLAPGAERAQAHTPPGVAQATVRQYFPMAEDSDGTIVSNNDNGLLRRVPGGWREYGASEGLKADGGISAMLVDRDGDLWLGLAGRGLAQWQGYRGIANWTTAQGLPSDDIWSFHRAGDGTLYLGTGRGMAIQRPGEARFSKAPGGYQGADHQLGTMARDRAGNLWSGTFSGALVRHDARTGRGIHVASLPLILRLFVDTAGRLWIATNRGLYVIDDPERSSTPRLLTEPGPLLGTDRENNGVSAICQTGDGTLWFAAGERLLRLAGGRWSLPKLPAPINMLSCDAGTLWLSDVGHDAIYYGPADAGADTLALARLPLAPTPMAGRAVMSMHVDRRHWLWIGSDAGVAVWSGKAWRVLNQQSGMVWNDSNQYAIFEDADGSMWIGTSSGASHIVHPQDLFAPRQLALRIESVDYDGNALGVSRAQMIAWSGGALEVRLAVLSFQNHEALRFRYRLKGLESAWSVTDTATLRYPALAPGRYVLQVAAENTVLQAAAGPVELPLTIMPPWWQSGWFYSCCALLALTLAWLLYRWRLRGILRRSAEMEQLVRERTLELEASREEHRMRSLKDGLTKAWNRVAIMEMIGQQIATTTRAGGSFMVVLLDLDHFKRINDTYGHLAGDAVLKEFVRRLSDRLRGSDVVGRYGGEEFILLLPGLYAGGGEQRIRDLHREICAEPVVVEEGVVIDVACSFGVVAGPQEGCTPESLLKLADQALYRAKENGRNRIEYAEREP
ncbi:MAG TPA: diguanylate cyclase [Duganella sp.]|uniref:diguanylate cyclase n=1 Tax=Duganella sp. TaxID=1904440 RepID=UPI002ED0BF30